VKKFKYSVYSLGAIGVAGLSMGMLFLWEFHGKRPMEWNGTAHIWISYETQK